METLTMMKKGMIRSMRGEVIDMNALAARNSTVVALGNAHMNARGDLIDKSGNVVKTRETIVQEYYNSNPRAVTQTVSLKDLGSEVMTPAEAISQYEQQATQAPEKKPAKKRKIIDEDFED